jgi:hypothetical protein
MVICYLLLATCYLLIFMKKIIFYLILPVFLLNFSLATLALPALAGTTDINSQQGFEGGSGAISEAFGQSGQALDIRTIIANLIVAVLSLLGIIFVVLLVYAGFKYMTAMGNADQADSAKSQITQAVIGLLIVLAAYGIAGFVFNCALGATGAYYIFTSDICGPH